MINDDITTWSDAALRGAYRYSESPVIRAAAEAELSRRSTTPYRKLAVVKPKAPVACVRCVHLTAGDQIVQLHPEPSGLSHECVYICEDVPPVWEERRPDPITGRRLQPILRSYTDARKRNADCDCASFTPKPARVHWFKRLLLRMRSWGM